MEDLKNHGRREYSRDFQTGLIEADYSLIQQISGLISKPDEIASEPQYASFSSTVDL